MPRRSTYVALTVATLLVSIPRQAGAFSAISGFGYHAEHRRITRLALQSEGFGPATFREIVGGGLRFGAVAAADKPWRGLSGVKAAHCDGGDHLATPGYPQTAASAQANLLACRAFIWANFDASVAAAAPLAAPDAPRNVYALDCRFNGRTEVSAKCAVLGAFGLALHAAQDFYAHTNWTDANPGPATGDGPPGLGGDGPAPFLFARDAPPPPGLISGCFEGYPEGWRCEGRVRHRDLNKDTGAYDATTATFGDGLTPRGRQVGNFRRAASAAVADSQARWRQMERQIYAIYGAEAGDLILCRLKSDRPADCR